jgi:hypothetical protein
MGSILVPAAQLEDLGTVDVLLAAGREHGPLVFSERGLDVAGVSREGLAQLGPVLHGEVGAFAGRPHEVRGVADEGARTCRPMLSKIRGATDTPAWRENWTASWGASQGCLAVAENRPNAIERIPCCGGLSLMITGRRADRAARG